MLSAHGSPDVDSERAADEPSDVYVEKRFERDGDRTCGLLGQLHVRVAAKEPWMVRLDSKRRDDPPEAPLAHEENKPSKGRRPLI
jgi:hypothetical protein